MFSNSFIRTFLPTTTQIFVLQVFVFYEEGLVIYKELLSSFGLALAAVLILSLVVLGKVGVVLLVCLTLVSGPGQLWHEEDVVFSWTE